MNNKKSLNVVVMALKEVELLLKTSSKNENEQLSRKIDDVLYKGYEELSNIITDSSMKNQNETSINNKVGKK